VLSSSSGIAGRLDESFDSGRAGRINRLAAAVKEWRRWVAPEVRVAVKKVIADQRVGFARTLG